MGHASVGNLTKIFLRRIYAKGYTSIRECVDIAEKKGEEFRASEGGYKERYMLSMGFSEILLFYTQFHKMMSNKRGDYMPVVHLKTALHRLSPLQEKVYNEFMQDGLGNDWDGGDDGESGEYGAFDTLEWEFTTVARKNYSKLPIFNDFTN